MVICPRCEEKARNSRGVGKCYECGFRWKTKTTLDYLKDTREVNLMDEETQKKFEDHEDRIKALEEKAEEKPEEEKPQTEEGKEKED